MLMAFGSQGSAQKSILEDPDASLGLAAPPLQPHKAFFGHSFFESRRMLRAEAIVNAFGFQ